RHPDGNRPGEMTTEAEPSTRERRPDRAALAIAVALAAVSGVVFWNTSRLGGAASYARIGPTAFPFTIAAGLMLAAIGTAVKAWRGGFPVRERDELQPILWIVGGLTVQMLSISTVGFSLATGLLFAATARGFGRGPLWMTIP